MLYSRETVSRDVESSKAECPVANQSDKEKRDCAAAFARPADGTRKVPLSERMPLSFTNVTAKFTHR
jgi:hypothetical protein